MPAARPKVRSLAPVLHRPRPARLPLRQYRCPADDAGAGQARPAVWVPLSQGLRARLARQQVPPASRPRQPLRPPGRPPPPGDASGAGQRGTAGHRVRWPCRSQARVARLQRRLPRGPQTPRRGRAPPIRAAAAHGDGRRARRPPQAPRRRQAPRRPPATSGVPPRRAARLLRWARDPCLLRSRPQSPAAGGACGGACPRRERIRRPEGLPVRVRRVAVPPGTPRGAQPGRRQSWACAGAGAPAHGRGAPQPRQEPAAPRARGWAVQRARPPAPPPAACGASGTGGPVPRRSPHLRRVRGAVEVPARRRVRGAARPARSCAPSAKPGGRGRRAGPQPPRGWGAQAPGRRAAGQRESDWVLLRPGSWACGPESASQPPPAPPGPQAGPLPRAPPSQAPAALAWPGVRASPAARAWRAVPARPPRQRGSPPRAPPEALPPRHSGRPAPGEPAGGGQGPPARAPVPPARATSWACAPGAPAWASPPAAPHSIRSDRWGPAGLLPAARLPLRPASVASSPSARGLPRPGEVYPRHQPHTLLKIFRRRSPWGAPEPRGAAQPTAGLGRSAWWIQRQSAGASASEGSRSTRAGAVRRPG